MTVVVTPTRLLVLAIGVLALPALAAPDPAEQAYQAARKGYYALKKDPKRRKFRDSWLTVAHRFEAVAKKYPRSGRAPDSLFNAAQLLSDLSRISLLAEDATASMEDYRTLSRPIRGARSPTTPRLRWPAAHLEREQPEAARKVLQRAAQLPREIRRPASRPWLPRSRPSRRTPRKREGEGEPVARRELDRPRSTPAGDTSSDGQGRRPGDIRGQPTADRQASLDGPRRPSRAPPRARRGAPGTQPSSRPARIPSRRPTG